MGAGRQPCSLGRLRDPDALSHVALLLHGVYQEHAGPALPCLRPGWKAPLSRMQSGTCTHHGLLQLARTHGHTWVSRMLGSIVSTGAQCLQGRRKWLSRTIDGLTYVKLSAKGLKIYLAYGLTGDDSGIGQTGASSQEFKTYHTLALTSFSKQLPFFFPPRAPAKQNSATPCHRNCFQIQIRSFKHLLHQTV